MQRQVDGSHDVKVLVVDDEREIRDLLSEFLRHSGFKVSVARTGNEALQAVRQGSPGVVLLDIILPDLDGISVYETMRANRTMSRIPVVFFTALGDNFPTMFSRRTGQAPYALLSKPVKTSLLLKEIKRVLERSSGQN